MTVQECLSRLKNHRDNREFVCFVTAENVHAAKHACHRFFSLRIFFIDETFQCVYPPRTVYPILSVFKTASVEMMCEFLSTRFEQRFRALNSDISSTHAALDLKISVIMRRIANHPFDDIARRFIAMPNTISNSMQFLVANHSRANAKTAVRLIDYFCRLDRDARNTCICNTDVRTCNTNPRNMRVRNTLARRGTCARRGTLARYYAAK